MASAAVPLLVLGSTGRLGGFLRRAWPFALRGGLRPVWQARDGRPGCLGWDILADPAPPWAGGVVLVLAGGRQVPDINTAVALRALRAAADQGGRHVFLCSSAAVYAGGAGLHEDTALAPVSDYGAAKAAMEAAALDWQARHGGPGLTVLRIGNVAGADALLGARRAGPVLLDPTPDGRGPVRSYIGPMTLAGVLAQLCTQAAAGAALPRVVNVALPRPVAMADLAAAAGLPWQWGPVNPAVIPEVALDTGRLQALVKLPPVAGRPAVLVQEWRQVMGRA
jgi:hypothetical protein